MIKNQLYPYIEKYINEYLWGFSKEQFNVGVINGTIVLEKLNIRIDKVNKKLDLADTPFWLKSGSIQKIQVCCSLMNFIGEKPLEITIDNIDIILCPSAKWILRNVNSFIKENDFHLKEIYDPIDNNFHDVFLKKVNIYDGSILKSKVKLIEFFKDKSKISEQLNLILNIGLKFYYQKSFLINLKIKNIHIRFEDDLHCHMFLKPGLNEKIENLKEKKNKIAVGFTIQDFELNLSTDGNIKKNNFKADNFNLYYQTNAEIYIPIKTFISHLDNNFEVDEKYYEFLKNNLTDFNKIINNFYSIPVQKNSQITQEKNLKKNLHFQCNKIIDNLNFMGNFGINSTDKGNIDFFSKNREKNYKFYFQFATSDIKLDINDFILNYFKNILQTMRALSVIDTIQEFKPMRKPYNIKDPLVDKIINEDKTGAFNKKRKLVARDWLHYMIWFTRFKKAIYGKLDQNLLQDEFSRYFNICCNSSIDEGNMFQDLDILNKESLNKQGINTYENMNQENFENNLKKELNPEEINIVVSVDVLIKSITIKISKALNNFDKEILDANNMEKLLNENKNGNSVIITMTTIDKKLFLTKDEMNFTFALKSLKVEAGKNKIQILKNFEEKINTKNKALKSIIGSTAVIYKNSVDNHAKINRQNININNTNNSDIQKFNQISSSNSKSSLNTVNNSIPNLKLTMRPSNPDSVHNFINNAAPSEILNNKYNKLDNSNNYNNYEGNRNTSGNIENLKNKKNLMAIDEVLENIGMTNSLISTNRNRIEDSFNDINSKNNMNGFNKEKNNFVNQRKGNIVDILLEKENEVKNMPNKINISVKTNEDNGTYTKNIIQNNKNLIQTSEGKQLNYGLNKNYIDVNGNQNLHFNDNSSSTNVIKLVVSNTQKQRNENTQLSNKNYNNFSQQNIHNNNTFLTPNDKISLSNRGIQDSNTIRSTVNDNKINLKLRNGSNQFNNEEINLNSENFEFIQSEHLHSIKSNNFQELFKSPENSILNISSLTEKQNEISKLDFFEIAKIENRQNNNDPKTNNIKDICIEFSYQKKNFIEKTDNSKAKSNQNDSLFGDKICLLTGDFIFNISNNSIKEIKENFEHVISIKNLNLKKIQNRNFIHNLSLEKDLFDLRNKILEKLENESKLLNSDLSKEKLPIQKTDNYKQLLINGYRNEIENYMKHLRIEINKIDKNVLNDTNCDYRIHNIFEFFKKKSFEIEINIPNINILSFMPSQNKFNNIDNNIFENSNKTINELTINHLISRSKIPKFYLYFLLQSKSLLLKFLEYEYEFYDRNNSLKNEFSEFIEVIKSKYEILKYPIIKQLENIKSENNQVIEKKNYAPQQQKTYLRKEVTNEFEDNKDNCFIESNVSENTPRKIELSEKEQINNTLKINNKSKSNIGNYSNMDLEYKHKTLKDTITNNLNEGINKNIKFFEGSNSNNIDLKNRICQPDNKLKENFEDSADLYSFETKGITTINKNINSINQIISKNVSNNNVNGNKNPENAQLANKNFTGDGQNFNYSENSKRDSINFNKEIMPDNLDKQASDDIKNYIENYFQNKNKKIENPNDALNETVKLSKINNINGYDINSKKPKFPSEYPNEINKYKDNINNKRIGSKSNPYNFQENIYHSIEDLDEVITPNEVAVLKDIYVNKKHSEKLSSNEFSRINSPEISSKQTEIKSNTDNQLLDNNCVYIKNNSNESTNNLMNNMNINNLDFYEFQKFKESSHYNYNPYSKLNKEYDNIKEGDKNKTANIQKANHNNSNKNSTNQASNTGRNSMANPFYNKMINIDGNKNYEKENQEDPLQNKNNRNSINGKKKDEINEILNQYKMNSKGSQTKIATLNSKKKPIK